MKRMRRQRLITSIFITALLSSAVLVFFPHPVARAATTHTFTGTTATGLSNLISYTANSGDTIVLENDIVFDISGIAVSKTITLTSADADDPVTMQSAGGGDGIRHFYIGNGGRLILENITLDGGDICGGVYVFGSSHLTLKAGATIQNCYQANTSGGGVLVTGSELTMEPLSVIQNCRTGGSGGGVYLQDDGHIIINGGVVRNNEANFHGGGVGMSGGAGGGFAMAGGKISENSAINGGGIYVGYDNTFFLSDGEISDNSAENGGGVYIGSTILFYLSCDAFSGNKATDGGGGIYLASGSSGYINKVAFRKNKAANGGALNLQDGVQLMLGNTDPVTITENTATNSGGGIYVAASILPQSIHISATTFHRNRAQYGGGIQNNNVSNSMAMYIANCTFTNNFATIRGGAVGTHCKTEIWNSEFTYNCAVESGGAIYTSSPNNYSLLMINAGTTFAHNAALRAYRPPADAAARWGAYIKTTSSSIAVYGHPANNFDVGAFAYSVTFDSKGGGHVPTQIVGIGNKAAKPADPTKLASVFEGWYTDAACTIPYNFGAEVTANVALYAKWKTLPLNVRIPVKLLWAAFDDGEVASPEYSIVNFSEFPVKVSGQLANHATGSDEGVALVSNAPAPGQLRLDIVTEDGFSGLAGQDNPFEDSIGGLLLNQPYRLFGVLGKAAAGESGGGASGTAGWFKIGGRFGGGTPSSALKPVFAMNFSFEPLPDDELAPGVLPVKAPAAGLDVGYTPRIGANIDEDFRGALDGFISVNDVSGDIKYMVKEPFNLITYYPYWHLEDIVDLSKIGDLQGLSLSCSDPRFADTLGIVTARDGKLAVVSTFLPTLSEMYAWYLKAGKTVPENHAFDVTLTLGDRKATVKLAIRYSHFAWAGTPEY